MKRRMFWIFVLVFCSASQADDWGSIRGQIVVDGEIPERRLLIVKGAEIKDKEICAAEDHFAEDLVIDKESKGLANVFVYLASKPKSIHPDLEIVPKESVSIKCKGCQYVPHCAVLRTTQTIQVVHDDLISHHTTCLPLKNPIKSQLVPTSDQDPEIFTFGKPEPIPMKVVCNYHPWMSGYWLVVDHPYAALSDKDGRFSIDNLPVGEHQLKIWHERVGYMERKYKVTVAAGEPLELPVMKLDVSRFKNPSDSK